MRIIRGVTFERELSEDYEHSAEVIEEAEPRPPAGMSWMSFLYKQDEVKRRKFLRSWLRDGWSWH